MSNFIKDYMNTGLTLVNQININYFKNKLVVVHGKIQSVNLTIIRYIY